MTRPDRDRGATLVELIVVIGLVGVLSAALLAVIATFLRNDGRVIETIDETRTLQQLSNYVPRDITAALPLTFDTDPARVSPCPDAEGGVNVLSMQWHETFGFDATARDFEVSYRLFHDGDSGRLVRVSCQDMPYTSSRTVLLTDRLAPTADAAVADVNGGYVIFSVTTDQGNVLSVASTSSSSTVGLDDWDADEDDDFDFLP